MKKSKKYSLSGIKTWPQEDRPREKLLKYGEHTLTNTEILAILLRTGYKGKTAIDLSREILNKFHSFRNMSHTDLSQWKQVKGIGKAKISQIKAAIEIGRRFNEEKIKKDKFKIKDSEDVAKIFMPRMRDLKKEIFKIILLDSQNDIIDIKEITEGTVNYTNPIIREIFHKCLERFSSSVICVHNHPSGDPNPSKEDKKFTNKVVRGGKCLQIKVLDHIIIGNNNYFSFADSNLI